MIGRVTESMKYSILTGSISNVQVKSTSLMEKISTQKNINRPSDDPVGAGKVLNYSSTLASIDQYQTNITNAQTWLSLTDTNLEGIKDIIAEAEGIAIGASDDTMDANAAVLSSLIDEALSLMNAKNGDSYIFGGSKTDVAPFSTTLISSSISNTTASTVNKFDGTVTSDGAYTGTENKTYAVKIIDGGTPAELANATYQISSDGGLTWGITNTDLSGAIELGDGVTMTFIAGTTPPAANDLFTVDASTAGYYQGNDDELTVQVGKNNNFAYNITGSSAFTASGAGTVDLLATLRALKSALEAHDTAAAAAQIDNLSTAQTQVLRAQTEAGAKANTLELISSNLTSFQERITSSKSDIEDADLDKLIVSYQMEQAALEASYNLAAQIGTMTILDYLR